MDLGLSGRRAVVTGGARGIGRVIALSLAAEGCDVAVCSRIADVACLLLSDRASWISGANVLVDGGQNPPNMVTTQPLPGRWRE